MVFFTGLTRVCKNAGVKYRTVSGWKKRTAGMSPKGMSGCKGVLWHHTATNAAAVKATNAPTLNYVTSGLGYPLCNLLLAWDGTFYVVSAGFAAHAGKGSYKGIGTDNGNSWLIGIEVEGTTGLTWSKAQLEAAAKFGRQMDKEFGRLLHIGHYEWAPGRKTDPSGIPGGMGALRKAIKAGSWSGAGGTSTAGNNSSSKPAKPAKKAPWASLKTSTPHNAASHNAWVTCLAKAGYKQTPLTRAIQTWLRGLGYYRKADGFVIDGQMGKLTVQELQRFLKKKGYYKGTLDGSRGQMTVTAEKKYLNAQRKLYI